MTRTRVSLLIALISMGVVLAPGAWAQITPAAETGEITGFVRDKDTGRPLTPANVTVQNQTWGTMSLEDGSFVIKNVPVGTYTLRVEMMGYADQVLANVEVGAGETTRVIFEVRGEIVATIAEVQITGKKKKIDRTSTSTAHSISAADISALPVDNIEEVISLQAGVIAKGGELHFRGGRAGEVQYQVDGVPVRDPLVGGGVSLATLAIEDSEVLLGGLDAKYGNAQSGVVMYRTKEGGSRFTGEMRYMTDDYGSPSNTFDNYDRLFLGIGGPLPIHNMTFYISGETTYSDRYPKTNEPRARTTLLNFISVGERQYNSVKLQGKVAYKPGPNYKLTLEFINQEERYDNYIHSWSQDGYVETFLDTTRTQDVVLRHGRRAATQIDSTYQYYNAPAHTPDILYKFRQQKIVFRHSLSKNSQYSVRLSHQYFFRDSRVLGKNEWEYAGERDSDMWYNYRDFVSNDFFVIANDYPSVTTRETGVYQGIFDLTVRRGRHTIETGATAAYNDMRFFDLDRPYLRNVSGEIGSPRTQYHYYNPEGSIYVQDRWEHEGMVINVGLRYDVFSVGEQVPISEVRERVKQQLSPRVGIAYPISDRDVFSFHYGRFYQIPDRQYLFDDLNTFEGTRGNPNLTNETTVGYQAAIQHLFNDLLVGQFSVYYKDIFGLITAEETPDWTSTGNVRAYVNKDYASSKGFEVSLSRGFRNFLRWDLAYSYGVATGVASDPNAAVSRNFVYLPTGEQPLDWDARHSISANAFLGDRRNWGVSMTWIYTTGYPYTPFERDTRQLEPEMENSRRLPSTSTLDIRADKYYQLWGNRLSLFLQGRNFLDAKNITVLTPGNWPAPPVGSAYTVYYTETGRAGGAYLKDLNDDGDEEFVQLNDPRVFGAPRTIRVGIGYEF